MNDITKSSKVVRQVYQTSDYRKFITHIENRDIVNAHLKKITTSMMTDGWIDGSVVTIDQVGNVYDGHHRVFAASDARVPIDFVVINNPHPNLISKLNMNLKWSRLNHIKTHIVRNVPAFVKLANFMIKFPEFTATDAGMICANMCNSPKKEDIENGTYEVGDMVLASKRANQLREIKPYLEKSYKKAPFVRALSRIFIKYPDLFNFDEFMNKLKFRSHLLEEKMTSPQYTMVIEDIYNYKRKVKQYLR